MYYDGDVKWLFSLTSLHLVNNRPHRTAIVPEGQGQQSSQNDSNNSQRTAIVPKGQGQQSSPKDSNCPQRIRCSGEDRSYFDQAEQFTLFSLRSQLNFLLRLVLSDLIFSESGSESSNSISNMDWFRGMLAPPLLSSVSEAISGFPIGVWNRKCVILTIRQFADDTDKI